MEGWQVNELALFAGAGGGILGTQLLGLRVVCAVEIDSYCREVLLRRQEEGHLAPFPIWDDIRTFDGKPWRGIVDVVTAGFPCQPFSVAGKQKGETDKRNLWPSTIRIIREVRPRFALLENVRGLLHARGADGRPYFGRILGDLAKSGYDAKWRLLSAAEVGAPHRRDRLWIVANAQEANGGWPGNQAHPGWGATQTRRPLRTAWPARPGEVARIPRMPHGLAHGMDRSNATGEGQVPAVVAAVWRILIEGVEENGWCPHGCG